MIRLSYIRTSGKAGVRTSRTDSYFGYVPFSLSSLYVFSLCLHVFQGPESDSKNQYVRLLKEKITYFIL